jgi:anthranilate/para-aminobenzoate synthase component II
MKKCYIIDFEDSFTYNIASELKSLSLDVQVIKPVDIQKYYELSKGRRRVFLFGPGPGHPNDYPSFNEMLNTLKEDQDVFLSGICLGHQIICSSFGAKITQRKAPKHGVQIKYNSSKVQIYHSLAVEFDSKLKSSLKKQKYEIDEVNKECFSLKGRQVLTYQFHPESIGTSYRNRYFTPIAQFLL